MKYKSIDRASTAASRGIEVERRMCVINVASVCDIHHSALNLSIYVLYFYYRPTPECPANNVKSRNAKALGDGRCGNRISPISE